MAATCSCRRIDVAEQGAKDQVSRICRELDGQVEAFGSRPLEGDYPYLWLDAKHLKVRLRRPPRPEGSGREGARLPLAALHPST